jgi:hypothetical protein
VLLVGIVIPELVISQCMTRILSVAMLLCSLSSFTANRELVSLRSRGCFLTSGTQPAAVQPHLNRESSAAKLFEPGLPLPATLAAHRVAQMGLQHQLLTHGT